jgi:hypothetical protein
LFAIKTESIEFEFPALLSNIRRLFAFCKLTAKIGSGNRMAELLDDPMHRLFCRTIFRLRQSVRAVDLKTERRQDARRFRCKTISKPVNK